MQFMEEQGTTLKSINYSGGLENAASFASLGQI
jgi:hypothetical protein